MRRHDARGATVSPIARLVQRHDPERFVTALFAPAAVRETLFTLYAFNHELARAREVASVPLLALIRLQWWREVVQGAARAHEVAGPVQATIAAGLLDAGALEAMIEARMLEAEEGLDEPQWLAYLRGTGGTLMREAGRVLGVGDEGEALGELGAGCAAVGLLRNLAAHQVVGRWSFADGGTQDACRVTAMRFLGSPRRWSAAAVPAALPAVFARRALQRAGRDPFAKVAVGWAARAGMI